MGHKEVRKEGKRKEKKKHEPRLRVLVVRTKNNTYEKLHKGVLFRRSLL
jgi:hypothetical protein